MNNKKTRKTKTIVSSITLNSIRRFIERNFSIKQAAFEADISFSPARRLIIAIESGESDESIANTKKGRPSSSDPSLGIYIRKILDRDCTHTIKTSINELSIDGITVSKSSVQRILKQYSFQEKNSQKFHVKEIAES
ncbi:hypothetical protein CDIK_3575 [Cucumispora dikerogammari]|nr:hypothetical protein CDIK_3575 [Cucumispora dikerogammari]